jgi:hypothetical protein
VSDDDTITIRGNDPSAAGAQPGPVRVICYAGPGRHRSAEPPARPMPALPAPVPLPPARETAS